MYENFYRLSGIPFQLTPDSRFFFGSASHSRAISHLVYGLDQQEGFIVITGEVGAGKTTLVEQLWSQLDRRTYVLGRVVTTQVSGDDLLRLIVTSYGLEDGGADKASLLRRFERMVQEQRTAGRRCLLVVDEVQNLSVAALEELRMLSNITVSGRASVQTILLGQPQFKPILASADLEQLRQRVLASYHLGPLTEPETRAYVEHRLRTVGWVDDPHWEEAAFQSVYRHTDGIPRRVNTLCTRILLYGALEETHAINAGMVSTIATELEQDLGGPVAAAARAGPPADGAGQDAMARRIAALEHGVARQDRIFRRLLDLLGSYQVVPK
ncbi:MAG TPA: XrtA/PEP-CTERM system-associated ATPase [Acetobacteraceae bacterium]|nr:XrtA/PEP-CTERM system-associated ATPase [Acetobacteraceae bacterium]